MSQFRNKTINCFTANFSFDKIRLINYEKEVLKMTNEKQIKSRIIKIIVVTLIILTIGFLSFNKGTISLNNLIKKAYQAEGDALELLDNARFFYSMWSGYWRDDCDYYKRIRDFVKKHNLEKIDIHTSGHASIADLKKYVEMLNSPKIVPIHTFYPQSYSEIFKNVEIHQDGEWFTV